MSQTQRKMVHATSTSNLADLLERVLDKGIVIAGDIKVKLVDVELLTIQVRLMIASVDRARELGMDWWSRNPEFTAQPRLPTPAPALAPHEEALLLRRRLAELEQTAPAAAG